jgi:hypothetical protein
MPGAPVIALFDDWEGLRIIIPSFARDLLFLIANVVPSEGF